MIILLKLLIIAGAVGTLRSLPRFRTMSRELDEATLVSLRRMIRATEESGYPPETIPLLIALTTIGFMAIAATQVFGR